MKLAIASEVCSFELMNVVKEHLIEKGHEIIDLGMTSADKPAKFYETAPRVAQAILNGKAERGVLMCGTGMGVCLVANKFKGIYAGISESATTAALHYIINRANIICMGAWVVGQRVACDIVDRYLAAKIGEGFNEERRKVQAKGFELIKGFENENFK